MTFMETMTSVFGATAEHAQRLFDFDTRGVSCFILISNRGTHDIDSDSVCLAVTKFFKNHRSMYQTDCTAFENARREKLDFLQKRAATPVLVTQTADTVENRTSKWVPALKIKIADESKKHYTVRIVKDCSALRHSVHGNTLTINLSTIRIFVSTLPRRMKLRSTIAL